MGLAAEHAAENPSRSSSSSGKPNIIFILADDYGIPGVGCYGGAFKTPNLDKLAATGIRFEHCYSAPVCAPSRALAMFGRYAFRTGVLGNKSGPMASPDKEVCIAKTMKTAGYATAIAGKWRQLGYFTTREDGARWGWDEFMIRGVGKGEKGNRYWDPDYNKNGQPLTGGKDKFGPDLLNEFVVDFSDFYATFPEFSGAKLPEGVTLDSHSFAPQLGGEKGTPREWVYVQLDADRYVRDARWKLTGDGKLFDMADAPFTEKPATDEAARNRLQAVLDKLNPAPAPPGKKQAKAERKGAKQP